MVRNFWKPAILLTLSSTIAFGQTDSLTLSSGVVSPGGTTSLNLSLAAVAGSSPAGVQWTFSYSPSAIVSLSVSAGAAATAAGKSVSCAGSPGTYMCLLSGLNANTIQNGVAAIVTVTISPGTTATSIGITNALGASAAGTNIPITATGGSITTVVLPGLTLLVCNPSTVNSGASSTCTVTLNQAAPTGGSSVALTSSNAALTIPASVTVPANATSACFTATAGTISTTQNATITATLNGSSQTASLSLVPALSVTALACSPTSLDAGSSSSCTVTLSAAAGSGGVSVSLSSNSSVLTVPTSVTVPSSSTTAEFTVDAENGPPSGQSAAILTASLNGTSQSASFTVIICPCSVWASTAQPLNPVSTNKKAIEVGMKFTSDVSGYITGVRFYKGSTNTGTHLGNLWTSTGTLLATVTFTDETASGWQTAYFPSPVAIVANTMYVVSYHAPQGHNAADNGYFTNGGVNSSPLDALADGQSGPDGVYVYGSSAFPSTGASATNYWVDVVFNTSQTIGTATPVSLWTPANTPNNPAESTSNAADLGMTFLSDVPGYVTGLRFYKSTKNTGTHIGYLWTSTGTMLGSVTFTNESASGWQQANFASPVPVNANTAYVISYWSPKGHYADDAGYFATSGATNLMLYAPPDGQYGSNGSYNASDAFPTSECGATNYWVDVVFTTAIQ
jgi:hypothetical protein